MSNMRDQLLAKTSGIRATSTIKDDEVGRSPRTQTAPGLAGALAVAQLRVRELEQNGAASELPLGEITPNPWQPRRVFQEAKLSELAESIREAGLMQPIVVRRVENGYQIIAGERRWRAHKMLGLNAIKAMVTECSDADMAVLALVENISRDDLSDYEVAMSIRRSEKEFPSRKRMAEALGLSRSGFYQYLAFDTLPEFMKKDLDLHPRIIGGNAAQEIASALKKHGEAGLVAARELWPALIAGDISQLKFAAAIGAHLTKDGAPTDATSRTIEKLFAGKAQAGNITKDVRGFTVKFKAGMLTADQEREIRDIIGRFFSSQPKEV